MTEPKIVGDIVLFENITDEEIDISESDPDADVGENFLKYRDKILTFRNCPNLKYIKANSIGLRGLIVEKCPQLEYLDASNNDIETIDFSKSDNKLETIFLQNNKLTYFPDSPVFSSLKVVDVSSNQLTTIDLYCCNNLEFLNVSINNLEIIDLSPVAKSLKTLFCFTTFIEKLQVKKLKKLQKLYCNYCPLDELDCSNLEELRELYCFSGFLHSWFNRLYGLKKLNVKGCKALEILDCAENFLTTLELNECPNLHTVSCKFNELKSLTIKNCDNLVYLDFSNQSVKKRVKSIEEWEQEIISERKKIPTKLITNSHFNLQRVSYTQGCKIFNLNKKRLTFQDFPNLEEWGPGTVDDPAFEEWIDKKKEAERQARQQQEFEEKKAWDNLPTYAHNSPRKDVLTELDLSHWKLTGRLIIEDWPKLRTLNVGNNELQDLVVRNCPKLSKLIYAHNKMKKPATIENCPQLKHTGINFQNYQGKLDWQKNMSEEDKAYQQERVEQMKLIEEINDEVVALLEKDQRGETIELAELTKLLDKIKYRDWILPEYEQPFLILCLKAKNGEQKNPNPPPPSPNKKPQPKDYPDHSLIRQQIMEGKELITQLLTTYCLQTTDLPPEYQDWEQKLESLKTETEIKDWVKTLEQAIIQRSQQQVAISKTQPSNPKDYFLWFWLVIVLTITGWLMVLIMSWVGRKRRMRKV